MNNEFWKTAYFVLKEEHEELTNYFAAYKKEAQSNIQGLMSTVERLQEENDRLMEGK